MGVPLAVDFAKTLENRRVMELIYSSETFGRPYMMSPGVPAERVAALRQAFMTAMRDPELLAEAGKIGLVIDPISGEEPAGARRENFCHARDRGRTGEAGAGISGALAMSSRCASASLTSALFPARRTP